MVMMFRGSVSLFFLSASSAAELFQLNPGDHIAYVGNTLADLQIAPRAEEYYDSFEQKYDLNPSDFSDFDKQGFEDLFYVAAEADGPPTRWTRRR